jgi:hypothetical protein
MQASILGLYAIVTVTNPLPNLTLRALRKDNQCGDYTGFGVPVHLRSTLLYIMKFNSFLKLSDPCFVGSDDVIPQVCGMYR